MKTTTETTVAKFAVEGHGVGVLCIRGDDTNSFANRWTREAKLAKRAAWDVAKDMMRQGDRYSIVYVKPRAYADRSEAVFTAFRQVDGSWVDAKTGLTIAL